MKKNTKKTAKPEYIMNCTNLETEADVYNEMVNAKVRAGKAITEEELDIAKQAAVANTPQVFIFAECGSCEVKPKKLPWYKRFWRWLRRK